jgi:para-aminobenzoate synthetase/4-amino-4-deoxychorismate lyase
LYSADLDVLPTGHLEPAARRLAAGLSGPHLLRLVATPAEPGQVAVELESEPAAGAFDGRPGRHVSLVPTVVEGGLGPHKCRDRSLLGRRRAELGLDSSSQLLVTDSDGTVLETERANVIALVDGALVSPPPDGRLLAGVTVTLVFAVAAGLGMATAFRPITLDGIERAAAVCCTSAVRGLAAAGLVGSAPKSADVVGRLSVALFETWRSS